MEVSPPIPHSLQAMPRFILGIASSTKSMDRKKRKVEGRPYLKNKHLKHYDDYF